MPPARSLSAEARGLHGAVFPFWGPTAGTNQMHSSWASKEGTSILLGFVSWLSLETQTETIPVGIDLHLRCPWPSIRQSSLVAKSKYDFTATDGPTSEMHSQLLALDVGYV